MNIKNLRYGRVAARLPFNTLVQDLSPPNKYYLVTGGFIDSEIEGDATIVKFDVSQTEDGTPSSWCDTDPIQSSGETTK